MAYLHKRKTPLDPNPSNLPRAVADSLLQRLGGNEEEREQARQELLAAGPETVNQVITLLQIQSPALLDSPNRIRLSHLAGVLFGLFFVCILCIQSIQHIPNALGTAFWMMIIVIGLLIAIASKFRQFHQQDSFLYTKSQDYVQKGQQAAVSVLSEIRDPQAARSLLEACFYQPQSAQNKNKALLAWECNMAIQARMASRNALLQLLPQLPPSEIARLDWDLMRRVVFAGGVKQLEVKRLQDESERGWIETEPTPSLENRSIVQALLQFWERRGAEAVEPLLEVLSLKDTLLQEDAARSLQKILAAPSSEQEARLLLDQKRSLLLKLLNKEHLWMLEAWDTLSPQIALLDLITLAGSQEDVEQMERLAHLSPKNRETYLLRRAIQERRPAFRRREEQNRMRNTLLRPGMPSGKIGSEMLLRPAGETYSEDPQTMLRSSLRGNEEASYRFLPLPCVTVIPCKS